MTFCFIIAAAQVHKNFRGRSNAAATVVPGNEEDTGGRSGGGGVPRDPWKSVSLPLTHIKVTAHRNGCHADTRLCLH